MITSLKEKSVCLIQHVRAGSEVSAYCHESKVV
jgi:hypothetical protein